MSNNTRIEWCDSTISPIIGCTKISPACNNCYAEKFAVRLAGMPATKKDYSQVITNGKWNGKTIFRPKELEKPYQWKTPKKIFVVSMGDLFHESVQWDWIDEIMKMIIDLDYHTFIMLTKRPDITEKYFNHWFYSETSPYMGPVPIPNLWLGVTVENQEAAEMRIPILSKIPARVHFASCEPLLSEIDLECWSKTECLSDLIHQLDWIIVGGETGKKTRKTPIEYFMNLREQCWSNDIPFFFKKMGSGVETPIELDIHEFPFFGLIK